MRRYCFCLVVAAISLAPCIPAVATALDDYVNAPDPAYNWSLFATYPGAGYTHYILHMDSQTWLTASEVDRTVWEHEIVVTVPDTVSHDTAHLHIDGGSTTTVTTNNITELTAMAVETESIVARLRQVPNQPLTFVDGVPRTEDSLIAYGWDQFLRGGREEWLARFPMTKAAVRAMDAVSDFVATQFGGALAVNSFVVSGASKRGWTAWTTAAVDPRVVAVAPMVIDLLNLNPSFTHHYAALGYWAPAIGDYVAFDIPLWFLSRPYQDLLDLVDPYSYRMRYTMPKYLINAAGDQFFLPDSSQFYWDDLPGTKQLRYTPNAGHSRVPTQWEALSAWHNAIIEGDPLPAFTWTKEPDGSLRVFVTSGTPSQVLLWQGSNPTARNFNIDDVGAIYTSSALTEVNPGEYYAPAPTPAQGWTAFFIELTFPSGISHPFIFTTEVSVVPDTYVSAWDPDVDEDGIASSIDTDDDDDGQLDVDDYRPMDTDNDALPNLVDDDDDDDGILDGADPFPYDTDNDGLNNAVDLDDDSDGASDALELQEGTNPLDPNDTPVQMPVGGAALLVLLPACGAAAMRRRQRVDGEDR